MHHPKILRTPIEHKKRYSLWTLLYSKAKKRLTLRYTRVKTYTVPNEPQEK